MSLFDPLPAQRTARTGGGNLQIQTAAIRVQFGLCWSANFRFRELVDEARHDSPGGRYPLRSPAVGVTRAAWTLWTGIMPMNWHDACKASVERTDHADTHRFESAGALKF